MVEAEGIPPTASVASVGPSIRYIGNWVYAYSGIVSVNNIETTLLEFTTGAGIIATKIQFNMLSAAGDDYQYRIKFNDQVVQSYLVTEASDRGKPDNKMSLVIPPFTLLTATAQNITDTSGADQIVSLAGRVYDA